MRKLLKRALTLSLCICVMVGMTTGASAATPSSPLSPVSATELQSRNNKNGNSASSLACVGSPEIEDAELHRLIQKDYQRYLADKVNGTLLSFPEPRNGYWQGEGNDAYIYYGQADYFTCGVASVQMVMHNLNAKTYNEPALRTALGTNSSSGTEISRIESFLNTEQSLVNYSMQWYKELNVMKNHIWSTLTSKASPVMHVIPKTHNGWKYTINSGHYVTIYSMYSDKNTVAVADPYAEYLGQSTWRWFDFNTLNMFDSLHHGYMWAS